MSLPSTLIQLFKTNNTTSVLGYLSRRPDLIRNPELLGRAVRHGNLEMVRKLYDMGVQNVQEAIGYIVYGRKRDIAEFLIAKGADPLLGDEHEPVPVGACEVLNSYALKMSIKLSGNQLPDDVAGNCLAMLLSTYSRNPSEKRKCFKVLSKYGVKIPDSPPLLVHQSDLSGLRQKIHQNRSLLEQRFSEREIYPEQLGILPGDGLHLTPLNNSTLLHLATELNDLPLMQMLLEEGADPNARTHTVRRDGSGHTPLFHTVVSYTPNNTDRAQLLLDYGADPTLKVRIRKQLKYMDDEALEQPMQFNKVGLKEYAEAFPVRYWVSEPTLKLLP
ncbi:MAG: hypothetical protein Sapg2KO_48090 [Saprospiraceae bacterium]